MWRRHLPVWLTDYRVRIGGGAVSTAVLAVAALAVCPAGAGFVIGGAAWAMVQLFVLPPLLRNGWPR